MNEIETIIIEALKELLNIGEENKIKPNSESRLLFPLYRNDDIRISEQELRFLLVRKLENKKLYYSVETPTKEEYTFTSNGSRSGNLDLCLHDEVGKRINIIELKYDNVDITSDFEKLLREKTNQSEETNQNYFVQFVKNCDAGTIPNIEAKYMNALDSVELKEPKGKDKIKSNVKIFLYVLDKDCLHEYEIKDKDFSKNVKLKCGQECSSCSACREKSSVNFSIQT
jgi:hypothetical protein